MKPLTLQFGPRLLLMIVILVLLVFLAKTAYGQPRVATHVELFHQTHRKVGLLQEVEVKICNTGREKLDRIQALQVWGAVKAIGFDPANHVTIRQQENSFRSMSARRKILLGIALGSAGFAICDQSNFCKIGSEEKPEGWKAIAPLVSTTIPTALVFVEQNIPETELAQWDRMVPPAGFSLEPGQCVSHVMYGNWR